MKKTISTTCKTTCELLKWKYLNAQSRDEQQEIRKESCSLPLIEKCNFTLWLSGYTQSMINRCKN